jgi:hypothetical protein
MALAAKYLGEATPSCHVRRVGEWPYDKWNKDTDTSEKGDRGDRPFLWSNATYVKARRPHHIGSVAVNHIQSRPAWLGLPGNGMPLAAISGSSAIALCDLRGLAACVRHSS